MKTKKFNKKLHLNKTTISDLNKKEMEFLKGGGSSIWSCRTCIYCDTNISCEGICPC